MILLVYDFYPVVLYNRNYYYFLIKGFSYLNLIRLSYLPHRYATSAHSTKVLANIILKS